MKAHSVEGIRALDHHYRVVVNHVDNDIGYVQVDITSSSHVHHDTAGREIGDRRWDGKSDKEEPKIEKILKEEEIGVRRWRDLSRREMGKKSEKRAKSVSRESGHLQCCYLDARSDLTLTTSSKLVPTAGLPSFNRTILPARGTTE